MEYSFVLFVIIELSPGSSGQFEHVTTRTECSSQQIHICWSLILSGSQAISSHLEPSQAISSHLEPPRAHRTSRTLAAQLLFCSPFEGFTTSGLVGSGSRSLNRVIVPFRWLRLLRLSQTRSNLLSLQPPVTNNIAAWGSSSGHSEAQGSRSQHAQIARCIGEKEQLTSRPIWLNPGPSLVEVLPKSG